MADLDLKSATIVGVSRLLQSRQLSPVELVQATLERIEALNPRLNAYTTATPEYALERARQAEEEISKGTYRGPMHGIPYSLKDLIDTDGIRTTYGYRSHQDYVPSRSATVHTRLEEEGGVLVGKVDCHYMRSDPAKSLNPWDLSRSPGMSSSGVRRFPGCLHGPGLHRLRHRRVHPLSRRLVRGGGPEGHLRSGKPPQRAGPFLVL